MGKIMKQRRGTAAAWSSENPVLEEGEIGVELDGQKRMKVGDGVTPWNSLTPKFLSVDGGTMLGALSLVAPTQPDHAARLTDVESAAHGLREILSYSSTISFSNTARPWLRAIKATVVGGGGGGGGSGTSGGTGGAGGGGGGTAISYISAASLETPTTLITVGSGGASGAVGGIGGDAGGSSFGSFAVAGGGNGGSVGSDGTPVGGARGVATVGDILLDGSQGGSGDPSSALGGLGGASSLSGGGGNRYGQSGLQGWGPGAGGGGGGRVSSGGTPGGGGGSGIVILELYG